MQNCTTSPKLLLYFAPVAQSLSSGYETTILADPLFVAEYRVRKIAPNPAQTNPQEGEEIRLT